MTRRVWLVAFDGVEMLDLSGPAQALHEAALLGAPWELHYCGASATVRSAQGLELTSLAPLPAVTAEDWIIIPGYPVRTARPPASVVRWLRGAHRAGATICSVCTGAFALGEAGLLDGIACTTHWRRTEEMQARFRKARVVGDRLFVRAGRVMTSAGVASGIDMALAIIEEQDGPLLAAAVARELVVYMRRDGAHRQESVYLDYQTHLSPGVHRVQQWLVAHPDGHATLRELGRIAAMSPRHLTRVFRRATGISIQEYRTRLRLEHARTLMRNPQLTLEAVAASCGFANARQLRRQWTASYGDPPTVYRRTITTPG